MLNYAIYLTNGDFQAVLLSSEDSSIDLIWYKVVIYFYDCYSIRFIGNAVKKTHVGTHKYKRMCKAEKGRNENIWI